MATQQQQINLLKAADVALGARIDKEVNARVVGDTALDARIDTLEAQVKALLVAGGGGGGTTPEPPNEPPPPTPDTTPPTIPSFTQNVTGQTTVTFVATTNEPSTVVFEYGTTTGLGTSTAATASGTSHSKDVTGLTAGTTYYVVAKATDTAGNGPTLSSMRQFRTNDATPIPPPGGDPYVVTSISALKAALANNSITLIEVANGTYSIAPASSGLANSLNIGTAYASRTNPVTVRAATPGGVTFDGGGAPYTGAIWFYGGAHHQTWEGFRFANCKPTQFGVVVFGRLNSAQPTTAPHHITMNDCDVLASCTSSFAGEGDHAVYIKAATGGVNNITLDGWTVNGSGGINTFIHIYDDSGDGAFDIDVTNFSVTGTHKAIMVWWASAHDLLFQNGVITNATKYAISPYRVGASVVFDNVDSTGSGIAGNEGTTVGSPTINPNCSLA